MMLVVASASVIYACVMVWHSGLYLLRRMGLWLAWRNVLVAAATIVWIMKRIEATAARARTNEEEPPGQPVGEQVRGGTRGHHLVRALRESAEWEILNCATCGSATRKVAYRRLARRFDPDRAKPKDKEVAMWCMREIDQIWNEPDASEAQPNRTPRR